MLLNLCYIFLIPLSFLIATQNIEILLGSQFGSIIPSLGSVVYISLQQRLFYAFSLDESSVIITRVCFC